MRVSLRARAGRDRRGRSSWGIDIRWGRAGGFSQPCGHSMIYGRSERSHGRAHIERPARTSGVATCATRRPRGPRRRSAPAGSARLARMSAPRLARRTRPWLAALVPAALAGAASLATAAPAPAPPPAALRVQVVADGFDHPLFLCAAPGDPRLFVVEQPGRIRWIENGRPSTRVFLDASALLRYGGEQGLLGLVFHPAFGTNSFFY